MGASYTTPAIPPLAIDPSSIDAKFAFILEDDPWPLIHVLIPFSIYYYYQSFWFTFLLIGLNEVVEGLLAMMTSWSVVSETVSNSAGDVLNGLLGITLAHLLLILMKWRYYPFSLIITKYSRLGIYFKYAFQLILILASLLFYLLYFKDGHASIGIIIVPIWIPLMVYAAYKWNRKDSWWIKSTSVNQDLARCQYKRTHKQRDSSSTKSFYFYYVVFVVLFLISFSYRYTHVYIMAVGHGILALLIMAVIWVNSKTRK